MEEINIIELLKRVKEGNAPKKIEINGNIYNYKEWKNFNIRFMYENDNYTMFIENISFDTKIKILDKPIIKKLEKTNEILDEPLIDKINEIIDYITTKENK